MSAWCYDAEVVHVRTSPVRHELRSPCDLWLVDLDHLPRLPRPLRPLARFESRDHEGDPRRSIRENVDAFLADNGIDLHGGRIAMLAGVRSLGYVFNPLSLFWCHDRDETLTCVVAEVHNTYGQAHRYLLRTDDAGRAEVEKAFYVSPFYPVDGYYRMRVPEPGERLELTVTLHRPGERPFTASVRGTRRPVTNGAVLRNAARRPLGSYRVRASITWHGITLWRKGLPIQAREVPGERGPSELATPTEETTMPSVPTTAERLAVIVHRSSGVGLPVRIRAWDGSEAGPAGGPVLVIRSKRALRRLLWAPGELGLARAYVSGDLDVEGDLAEGLRRAWHGFRSARAAAPSGRPPHRLRRGVGAALSAARLGCIGLPAKAPVSEARLSGRLHTRGRDRAAIAHHYDLSNDFYRLLLDPTMAYSCAYFTRPDQPLVEAQHAKLDLICRKLGLSTGMRLLDVGCGWGSLILHAAEHYGVRATGITLSAQQRDHVAKQVADRGLDDVVDVRLQDYRELAGNGETFDAVSSIEMGEHVGQQHYPVYAAVLRGALEPGGRLLLQQMSRRHDAAPGGGALIQSYIAPDMHMQPLSETLAFLEATGLEVRDVESLREHYVRTVAYWIDTLETHQAEFTAMVGDERVRVWRLYLVGGALSFEEGRMGVDQILAARPREGASSAAPATRRWAVGVAPQHRR